MAYDDNNTDDYKLQLGSLRSDVTITLHTYHAFRIWNGVRRSAEQEEDVRFRGIPGMQNYFAITNLIKLASGRDDPFADWWMIRLEERIEAARQRMDKFSVELDAVMERVPAQISISDNLNQKPVSLPLYVGSHLGFHGVYLLTAYDQLVRKVLLANHTGLLGRLDTESYFDLGAHELRSLIELAVRFRNTGASRDDMAANNARAREAIEKLGLPPEDILQGIRRSEFAPRIIRPKAAVPVRELRPAVEGSDDAALAAFADDEQALGSVAVGNTPAALSEQGTEASPSVSDPLDNPSEV